MENTELKLTKAPIIEAVLDIDCDLPSGSTLADLQESAKTVFSDHYPVLTLQFFEEFQIDTQKDDKSQSSVRKGIQAIQFRRNDGKQIVQLRAQGFSFNQLAPYPTNGLDDFLPQIRECWERYVELVRPVKIRQVRLRYINKIDIPLGENRQVHADDFFTISPRLSKDSGLAISNFLHQYVVVDIESKNKAVIVFTNQELNPSGKVISFILDISVMNDETVDSLEWSNLTSRIYALRSLKNKVFTKTLTQKCLNQYR